MDISPAPLVAGMLGVPIVGNALGRRLIAAKADIANDAEANAELRRLLRNFAIFDGLLAIGLGYAASRADVASGWRSVLLGGSIGTGLLSATLAAALLAGPEAAAQQQPPAALPAGTPAIRPGWYSNIIGAGQR